MHLLTCYQGPSLSISPLPAPHPPTIFLFGGKLVVQRRLTAEMWAFDINSRAWSRVDAGKGPGARYFHSMDTWEDKLVCFGGMADNNPNSDKLSVHNDVWMFDCRSRKWLPQPSPEAPISTFVSDSTTVHASAGVSSVQDPALLPTPRYAHLSAISRGNLMICGGQRMDNSWIYEMNVYDLERSLWVSKTDQPESHGLHSKGAYRSATASSPYRVIVPPADSHTITGGEQTLPYTVDEPGSGGDVWCYSNYDFAKVRRELEVLAPLDDGDENIQPPRSDKYASPPGFRMKDLSNKVSGSSQPPGLRFPRGGIIGNHFVLCGLYLASTSAAFSIWTLDLTKQTWKHIEPPVLASGSWNIVALDRANARLFIFGNSQSDLAADYGKRAVSLAHVAVIELEAFGIYEPPRLILSDKMQEMGLSMLNDNLICDFEIVCEDGRRIKCSRKVLTERWSWFAEQQATLIDKSSNVVREIPSMDINDALLGSVSPVRFTPNRLHLPEPLAVCVALIQYFYTLNLTTSIQTRAPVLCSLLFLAKQYKIERLNQLVLHALHSRLEPGNAVQIYEVAALAGEQNLSARALAMVNPKSSSSSSRSHTRRPGGSVHHNGGGDPNYLSAPPTHHHPSRTSGSGTPLPTPPTQQPGNGPSDHGEKKAAVEAEAAEPVVEVTEPVAAPTEKAVEEAPSEPSAPKAVERSESTDDKRLMDALDLPSPAPKSAVTRLARSDSRLSIRSLPLGRRHLPPALPPPERPLPFRPESSQPEELRSNSPTNSDATSLYPRTPPGSSRSSRDLALSRDASPMTPSILDRRPSLAGTPTKVSLPALPEEQVSRLLPAAKLSPSLDDSEQEEALLDFPTEVSATAGLTRAVSLNIITPRLHAEPRTAQVHRRRAVESMHEVERPARVVAPPPRPQVRTQMDSDNVDELHTDSEDESEPVMPLRRPPPAATSTSTLLSATSYSSRERPASLFITHQAMYAGATEDEEQERLAKFQEFIAEQQRSLGLSPAHAYDAARRATGKAGKHAPASGGNKLSRLGARFADALLSDRWA
jgi:hypothetical protein